MISALHDPGTQIAAARSAVAHRDHVPQLITPNGARIVIGIASWTDPSMTSAGVFYPEGVTSLGFYNKIHDAFPDAELVNANLTMEHARFVRSEEEIAFIGQAVGLVENALELMRREARPGVPENVVYARMLARHMPK